MKSYALGSTEAKHEPCSDEVPTAFSDGCIDSNHVIFPKIKTHFQGPEQNQICEL